MTKLAAIKIDVQNLHKALAFGYGDAARNAVRLAKSPIAQRLWSGTKRVAHAPLKMLLTDTPKWMYPLYGAAAISPVLGYEVNKRNKAPEETKEASLSSILQKRSTDIELLKSCMAQNAQQKQATEMSTWLNLYGPPALEKNMIKASGAIATAISRAVLPSSEEEEKLKPENLTPGLDNLKSMIQKAKERAAFRDNPERTMRSGD